MKKLWTKHKLEIVVLVPVLIHFTVFYLIPLINSLKMSVYSWPIIGRPTFTGLENWVRLFNDDVFRRALWNTFLFSVYYVVPTMAVGLCLALLVNQKRRGAVVFRVLYFLPVVTAFVVVAAIWKFIFRGDANGLANYFLSWVGIEPQLFLSNPRQALVVLAGLSIFKVCGSAMVYYYAGLKTIPGELYEAAVLDGASNWQRFWKITFPLLKPTTFFVAVIISIGSFQVFDSTYLLTQGGPNYATVTLVYNLYETAFSYLQMGYASAQAYVLFVIILTISLIQRRYLGEEVSYY